MKILIVEDDMQIATLLKTFLEEEYYTVDLAYDGKEGLSLAISNSYDLIILDNELPYMTGKELCLELRKRNKQVKILFLTQENYLDFKVEMLSHFADDYLPKPFAFTELLARIKALQRRPAGADDTDCSCVGDLTIDRDSFRVKRAGVKIPLTKKEFRLLELLARNKGKVISRRQIIEQVWEANADIFSRSIETHIKNIRKKIELPGKRKLIHTVSGRGYMLE